MHLDTMSFKRQDAYELNEARKTLGLAQKGAKQLKQASEKKTATGGKRQQVAHRIARTKREGRQATYFEGIIGAEITNASHPSASRGAGTPASCAMAAPNCQIVE